MDYTVEAELLLRDNVSEVLLKIGRSFTDINRSLKTTQEGLDKVAMLGGLVGDMERLTKVSRELAEAQASIARSARESAAAMKSMSVPTNAGGARRGGGHAMAMDLAIGGQMVGDAGIGFFGHAISAAMDADHTMALIRGDTRVTDAQAAEIRKRSEEVARAVPGSTIGGNLEIFNDLKNTFGDTKEALEQLQVFSGLVTTLQMADRRGGGAGDMHAALDAARFIEDQGGAVDPKTGKYNPDAFTELARRVVSIDTATQGRVGPHEMLQFQKMARTGGMMMGDHALYEETPYFANALGASRLGTALFANTQVMLAGRLAKENEQYLESIGVIKPGSGHYAGTGKNKHWEYNPADLKDRELAKTDVYKWIHDTLAAAIANAFHIDPTTKEGQAEIALKMTQGAQRGNMGGLWADVDRNYATAQKEGANIAAQNADMLKHFLDTDPTAKLMAFNAAENELLVTLGSALMGPAVDGLKALTAGLRDLTDWAREHPEASKDITVIAAGLALLAKGASELALVVFIGGPLVSGVTALGAAATAATAPVTALVAAIGAIAKMGSDSFTPENRKALDDLAKQRRAGPLNGLGEPQDGYGPDGLPIQKEPGRGHGDKLGQINIHVDGDKLASIVVDRIGRAAGPLSGPGTFDPRRSYTPIEVG